MIRMVVSLNNVDIIRQTEILSSHSLLFPEHEPLHQPEQHVENFEDANQSEVNNSQIVEQETMQQSQQSEEKYEEVSNQNEVSVEN